jgi:hypothetical protein
MDRFCLLHLELVRYSQECLVSDLASPWLESPSAERPLLRSGTLRKGGSLLHDEERAPLINSESS